MGLSATTTIFLFVVCLCGGIIIGAMFSRLKKTPPEATPPEAVDDQKKEMKEPASTENRLARAGETEILRAWRDEADKIWLEMDGQRLETKDALQADQKKNLLKLVLDLRPWLDAVPASAPKPQVQEPPPPAESTPRRSLFSPRATKAEKLLMADDLKPKVNLKSIVEQIDDVLQEKLTGTAFSSLEIHLLEGPGGEVMVQIGALKHAGVEAIPNPEIQALIHQAVADWEKGSK
jgi:hypothetical protein